MGELLCPKGLEMLRCLGAQGIVGGPLCCMDRVILLADGVIISI